MAILTNLTDFEFVGGALSQIDLTADVLPNRTGAARQILYGKDLAVIEENYGLQHRILNGANIRGKFSLATTMPSAVPFSLAVAASAPHTYEPRNNQAVNYNGGTFSPVMRFATGFPSPSWAGLFFTPLPLVTAPTYQSSGARMTTLSAAEMAKLVEDIKCNQYAHADVWVADSTDGWKLSDVHEGGLTPTSWSLQYTYTAADSTGEPTSPPTRGDWWTVLDTQNLSITYPTAHIASAELWVAVDDLQYYWEKGRPGQSSEIIDRTLDRFVFRMATSTNGVLTWDQSRVKSMMRLAVDYAGLTIPDMDRVAPYGAASRFYLTSSKIGKATIILHEDDHCKWW